MANVQFTAEPSALAQKLPNFPLPRELRDQIYGYLLDSDHTRVKRTYEKKEHKSATRNNRTGPRAYHFHTNLLAVNRVIHDETEKLLYKRNMFVVISYQLPSLNKTGAGLFTVPVVSRTQVGSMQYHSLRIHISAGKNRLKLNKALDGVKFPAQSYILLIRDIDAFSCTGLCACSIRVNRRTPRSFSGGWTKDQSDPRASPEVCRALGDSTGRSRHQHRVRQIEIARY